MTRQDYFERFKIRNALIQKLAEGMAEDYKAMENDYHPADRNAWRFFDPQGHFERMLESAQWAGANSDDDEMELDEFSCKEVDYIYYEAVKKIEELI